MRARLATGKAPDKVNYLMKTFWDDIRADCGGKTEANRGYSNKALREIYKRLR